VCPPSTREAQALIDKGALVVDIRDTPRSPPAQGPRRHRRRPRLLEFKADPTAPSHDPQFRTDAR